MRVLVTGAAGFIGAALSSGLLERGDEVVGVDNLNDYYDVRLKEARLARIRDARGFRFLKLDLADRQGVRDLFASHRFDVVVNLAAQAGVRHSLEHPEDYVDANLVGFANVLEGCRHGGVGHLVFASSSSVYGANTAQPSSEHDNVDHPLALYAASKKANELMAHAYAHLYGLPCTGLRFFTVYGPWGRPDMALFLFTRAIAEGRPVEIYNYGDMMRDWTYIDDVVEGVVRVVDRPARPDPQWSGEDPDPATSNAPYRIYNIGNSQPVKLTDFVEAIEEALGKRAERRLLPMQPGDVPSSFADVGDLERDFGFRPRTPVREGIRRFLEWYVEFYGSG